MLNDNSGGALKMQGCFKNAPTSYLSLFFLSNFLAAGVGRLSLGNGLWAYTDTPPEVVSGHCGLYTDFPFIGIKISQKN